MINFWSVTCLPCLREIPQLSKLVSEYSGKDVVFLALAPEAVARVEKTLANRSFTYKVLPEASLLFSALGIQSYPYHLIVDKRGAIKSIYHGSYVEVKTNQVVLDQRLIEGINIALKD